jgi:HEAT repeats
MFTTAILTPFVLAVAVAQEAPFEFPPGSCVLPLPQVEIDLSKAFGEGWLNAVDAPDPTVALALLFDPRDLVLADVSVGGVGDDLTLQRMVNRLAIAVDPKELCRLAHHLHVQSTRRWGTVWVIDGAPVARLHQIAKEDALPLRRAFALVAIAKGGGTPWEMWVADTDVLVRAAGARWLRAPNGVKESDAARVVDALFELARSDHASTRVVAVRALGSWIHTEEQNADLLALALGDSDPSVRGAALEALAAVRSLSARVLAKRLAADTSLDTSLRDAARRAVAATGILPD